MKRKKTAVVVIIVVLSVITILISMWIVNENKHSKKDQEIDGDFIKKVIKSGKLDRLTPIGIDRFMADVPQIKMPISTANYLQTLNNFNTVFPIDSITRLDDNRVAVVYLLKSEKNSLFAVLLFEKTILDSSEKSSIYPKLYSYLFYAGYFFFYSEQLSSLIKETFKVVCSFSELEKEYAGISDIVSKFFDGKTKLPIWTTRILTDEGGKLIVFGFDGSILENGDDMRMENSRVIEIMDVGSDSFNSDWSVTEK